jgi:thioredoxin-like negative regulator of GroEL
MTFGLPSAIEISAPRIHLPEIDRIMEKNKFTKIFVILAGLAFLGSSVAGLSGSIGSSMNEPIATQKATQSQNAQLAAEEKGFAAVLQREPNNQTALKGLVSIRLRSGDMAGTRTALAQLVKLNPADKQYQELLSAIDKQIIDSKNAGNAKSTEQGQPLKNKK